MSQKCQNSLLIESTIFDKHILFCTEGVSEAWFAILPKVGMRPIIKYASGCQKKEHKFFWHSWLNDQVMSVM